MPYINVGQENSATIDLYYEDLGAGTPVVLIHGFPLSGQSWERQVRVLLEAGYRAIAYDRRGFGKSSQPSIGYDYDTFAADLDKLMTKLDLQRAVLVGFSMGSGEVTRYLSKYGSERVQKAVLLAPVPPFFLKTADNPEGIDDSVFDEIQKTIMSDRLAYLSIFFRDFFNADVWLDDRETPPEDPGRLSKEVVQASWNIAAGASALATLKCVNAWLTDFREDLPRIDVPTLIVHGDADRLLPLETTAARLPKLIKNSRLVVISGGPHAINWTHANEVNSVLLDFLAEEN